MSLLLFSSPDLGKLDYFFEKNPIYPTLHLQIEGPLLPRNYPAITHSSKRTFRLFMPLLAKLLGIDERSLYLIQLLWGLCFYLLLIRLVYHVSADKVATTLVLLGFSFLYIGKSFTLDYWAFFDGTAFLFLLLAISTSRAWLIFLSLSVAFWTDERAIVAAFSVYAFHFITHNQLKDAGKLNIARGQLMAIALALFAYCAIRFFLSNYYQLHIGQGGVGLRWSLRHFWKAMPLAIFMFLESFWFMLVLGFQILSKGRRAFLFISILLIGFLAQFITALSVGDMVRSGAYLFIPCLTCFVVVAREENKESLRRLLFSLTLMAFLIPTLANFGKKWIWMKSDLVLYRFFPLKNKFTN